MKNVASFVATFAVLTSFCSVSFGDESGVAQDDISTFEQPCDVDADALELDAKLSVYSLSKHKINPKEPGITYYIYPMENDEVRVTVNKNNTYNQLGMIIYKYDPKNKCARTRTWAGD